MATETDPRIDELKNQLMQPGLTESEINKIEKKLEILKGHE